MKFSIRHSVQSGMTLWGMGELIKEETLVFQSCIDSENWHQLLASLDRISRLQGSIRRVADTMIYPEAA